MIKCKVIANFYDNVEGVNRKVGEEFDCLPERAEYLSGKNELKMKAVEVIEVIPKDISHETKEEKPKKKGRKKIDTAE